MESDKHRRQMNVLLNTLDLEWADRDDFFAGGNMFLYFSLLQTKKNDFRGPDVFVVLHTNKRPMRKSWVIWEEGQGPELVIELLSDTTRDADLGEKFRVYERVVRVPTYVAADPISGEVLVWNLVRGRYEPQPPNDRGRYPITGLELELGAWEGPIRTQDDVWLRWFTKDGRMLLTGEERANEAAQRADQETQRANEEAQRANEEAQRANEEAQRADKALDEVERLKAELAMLRGDQAD